MTRTLLGLAGAIVVLLGLAGLTFSSTSESRPDFRFVNDTEPQTLDPHLMTGNVEGRIANAIFEGLTRRDAKTMRAAPGVAESWSLSQDQLRYVFTLRKDAKWNDGTPITAHDFVYSWKRLLDPNLGADYAYLFHSIRHAEAFNTYARRAAALSETAAPALSAWRKKAGAPISAARWQRFLADEQLHDLLKGTSDEALVEVLARQSGEVAAAELKAFAVGLKREAGRLIRELNDAKAHLGVDEGFFALDDRSLVVELRAPTAYFLELTSFYPSYPVPRHRVERHPKTWFIPPQLVSNGPFEIEAWRVNDRIRMVKSERYWGRSEVALGAVEALSLNNHTTALNLYLTGDVDWLPDNYPRDLVDKLKRRDDFYSNAGMIVYFYRFNTTRPPFDDVRVRQAINLAIDRRMIVDEVLRLGQLPAYSFVPPGMPGYSAPETGIELDIDKARRLLAEAGYPEGKGLEKIGILFNTNEQHKQIADVVADQLRRNLHIDIAPYNQEWQSYLSTVRSIDYDMARGGWIGDYADPNTFLDMWATNGGNNNTGFSSSTYDALLAAAANVEAFIAAPQQLLTLLENPARLAAALEDLKGDHSPAVLLTKKAQLRMSLLTRAEEILVSEEFPICPVYFYVVSGLISPRIGGFYSTLELPGGEQAPNLQDVHPLRDLTLNVPRPSAQSGEASR